MRIILELPTEGLAALKEPNEFIDCIRVLQGSCGCEIVVSKAGLGGLIEETLTEHGIPFTITRSEIQVTHGEFEIVDANEKPVGVRFREKP
jgi:hypothetical protein